MHYLVAISGGVDSSVVAAMLLEAGHQVTGYTFKVAADSNSKVAQTVKDAKRVADRLGIPLLTANLCEQFKRDVIQPFITCYAQGLTPNPCTLCNPAFKFKVLLEKAEEIGAERIATGHYAQIKHDLDGTAHLMRGWDNQKDQSYFLCNLRQEQLQKTHFPLGKFDKKIIRKMAQERNLPVANKPDSQEICFIEDDDYARFIKENYPKTLKVGNIVDKSGKVFFAHEGIQFYTIGQRKRIGAHTMRKYVTKLDITNNDVIIGDNEDLMCSNMSISRINWIIKPQEKIFKAGVKIRSTSNPQPATITIHSNRIAVEFEEPQRAITPGQAGAIYLEDEVLGGGLIDN